MSKLVLVAVGGNALIRAGQQGTAQEQFENAVETANAVVGLIKAGHRVVLTHGNGPQVGAMLTRTELSAAYAYRMPLDCCVAATQGEIGYVLQYAMWQALQMAGLNTPVVTLMTQVRVNAADPAFANPTKPVGPFYTKDVADRYRDLFGWVIRGGFGPGLPQGGPFAGPAGDRGAGSDPGMRRPRTGGDRGGGRRGSGVQRPRHQQGGGGRDRQGPHLRDPRQPAAGRRLRHRHRRSAGLPGLQEADAAGDRRADRRSRPAACSATGSSRRGVWGRRSPRRSSTSNAGGKWR